MKPEVLPGELGFSGDFLWGVSTSSYQTEGNNRDADLWDWERRRGWERSGRAANSWELWRRDLDCLAELGVNAYRFSVEWGRLFPEPGRASEEAFRHYGDLLGELKARGIRPFVCLHHFTHPAWFWKSLPMGWAREGAVERFLELARACARAFGGLASDWLTFNEPMVYLVQAHVTGYFPPGRRSLLRLDLNPLELRAAIRNMARAHREAAGLLKKEGGARRVGIAHNVAHLQPLSASAADRRAALLWDQFFHWNFLDGLVLGRMDLDLDGEAETVLGEGNSLDFMGLNYYTRAFVRWAPLRGGLPAMPLYPEMGYMFRLLEPVYRWAGGWKADLPKDDMHRELYPEGLESVVREAWRRYRLPVLVTENGIADQQDRMREVYLLSHLRALSRAAAEVPVLGYLYWSLLDNYEWGSFRPRFGLYRVAYEDGCRRGLTAGGRLFKEIIAAAGKGR